MINYILDGSSRRPQLSLSRCALLAAVTLLCCCGTLHAQLVYVDASDDLGGGPQNLFCASGGALSGCLVNNTAVAGDNLWGWIQAGAPDPATSDVNSNVYESNSENSPELRTHVAAPNGSYDVYVAFWSDVFANWQIRAGLGPNPGNNTLFGATNASGATVSPLAASAVWATPPLNNGNTVTDDDGSPRFNPLTGPNPFFENVMGGGGGTRLYVGQVNLPGSPVVVSGVAGFDVFVDDVPTDTNQRRSRFDGIAYVTAGTNAFLTATVDRGTGNMTLNNPTGTQLNIARYTVTSLAGALDSTEWDSVSVGGNPTITEADPWTITAPTPPPTATSTTALTENETTPTNGAQLAATTGAFNLGNVWIKSPFQDVQVDLELVGGAKMQFLPTYTGTAIAQGDFDGDGEVDFNDFKNLMSHLHVAQPSGMTTVQYYQLGDMNNNGVINRDDFIAFRSAYYVANPPGSGAADFGALLAQYSGVPEPSGVLLATLAGGVLMVISRRSPRRHARFLTPGFALMSWRPRLARRLLAAAAVAVIGMLLATSAQAVPVTGWTKYQGGANAIFLNGSENTNSPTFGTGANDAANDSGFWGSTSNVHLDPSEEAVLTGKAQLLGHTGAGREFRFGMWKKIVQPVNPNADPVRGWLGYMALNGAGTGAGRLEAKNPDSDFNAALFISDQGGNSARTCCSGPIPAAGSPLLDGSVNGPNAAGTEGTPPNIPRYWILAQNPPNGNAGFPNNATFTFEIRVGRYGPNEATVSGRLIADAPANYVMNIGGGLDFNGSPPLNPGATNYSDHVTFDFDRVGFLFGGALGVDQAIFQNVEISKNTIQTLDLLVNPTTGAASMRNNLAQSFEVDYYEITSTTSSLRKAGWTSLASTTGPAVGDYNEDGSVNAADYVVWREHDGQTFALPNRDTANAGPISAADYNSWRKNFGNTGGSPTQAWVEAGGSNDGTLSEATLGALALNPSDSVSLGNIFKTVANGGTQGTQDLRFFIALTNGSVVRGTVTYGSGSGLGSVVPEPGTFWLGLAVAVALSGCASAAPSRTVLNVCNSRLGARTAECHRVNGVADSPFSFPNLEEASNEKKNCSDAGWPVDGRPHDPGGARVRAAPIVYVDATDGAGGNTTLVDGSPMGSSHRQSGSGQRWCLGTKGVWERCHHLPEFAEWQRGQRAPLEDECQRPGSGHVQRVRLLLVGH